MFFGNQFIKDNILKSVQFILRQDGIIKKIEFLRGLYRYPSKMIGREFNLNKVKNNTDVLVIAAHPDDDVLGLGTTLYRHRLNDDNIVVAFATDGSFWEGESWRTKASESKKRSMIRYNEAFKALSQIGIAQKQIFCLGYPDGGTQRYLKYIAKDIQILVKKLKPSRIYVHCIEGGHKDHDMTSFVVKSICNKIGYLNVFEWTEYNPLQPIGTHNVKFLPSEKYEIEENIINITEEERVLKKKMLAFYESQDVEKFYGQGEAIRQANLSELEMELNEFCQLPKRKLIPILKSFNKSIDNS